MNEIIGEIVFGGPCKKIAKKWEEKCAERVAEEFLEDPFLWEWDLGDFALGCTFQSIGVDLLCHILGSEGLGLALDKLENEFCSDVIGGIYAMWPSGASELIEPKIVVDSPNPSPPSWPSTFGLQFKVQITGLDTTIKGQLIYSSQHQAMWKYTHMINSNQNATAALFRHCPPGQGTGKIAVYQNISKNCKLVETIECKLPNDYLTGILLDGYFNHTSLQYDKMIIKNGTQLYVWSGKTPGIDISILYYEQVIGRVPVALEAWIAQQLARRTEFSHFTSSPNISQLNLPTYC